MLAFGSFINIIRNASVAGLQALMSGGPSPRPEVVHLPLSNGHYGVNTSDCGPGCGHQGDTGCHGCAPSIRLGAWKLLVGWPGEDQLVTLPPETESEVPYGLDGGVLRGEDQCIG